MPKPFPTQGLRFLRGALACAAVLLGSGCAGQRLTAEVLMAPVQSSAVTGRAVFTEQDVGMRLTAHVTGLGAGEHRLRLTAQGGCEGPLGVAHEWPLSQVDAWSNAGIGAVLPGLTFAEILGKAVVVEAVPAGPLACGVAARR